MVQNDNGGEPRTGVFPQPILVPLDGTDEAEDILPFVWQIARGGNLPLILHGVVEPNASEFPSSMELHLLYGDQLEASALAHAACRLRMVAGRLDDEGVATRVKATVGRPAEDIHRVADEEGCGLIAMSTHSRSALGRAILGNVTDRVIHASSVPAPKKARAYQGREATPLKTIMLPPDGSQLAARAVPCAEALGRSLSLKMLLVRVVDLEFPVFAYPSYEQLVRFADDRNSEAARYLNSVPRDLQSRGLTVRTTVLRGSPAQTLLDFAHRTPNDPIAITTHGRSGLSRWLMGSVPEALIRASGDPVLVVRPNS